MYHPIWFQSILKRRIKMDYNNQNNNQTSDQGQGQYQSQNLNQAQNQPQYQNQTVYHSQNQSAYQNPYQNQSTSQNYGQYNNQYSNPGTNYNFGPQQPHYSSQNGSYSGQNQNYQPGGPYSSPYAQAPVKPGPNACQIISLILGILSLVCCCTGLPGMVLGAIGLILAIIGNRDNKHGVGTAGLVCSIVGLALGGILLLLSLWGVSVLPDSIHDVYEWM
jgi:hypothetical protein